MCCFPGPRVQAEYLAGLAPDAPAGRFHLVLEGIPGHRYQLQAGGTAPGSGWKNVDTVFTSPAVDVRVVRAEFLDPAAAWFRAVGYGPPTHFLNVETEHALLFDVIPYIDAASLDYSVQQEWGQDHAGISFRLREVHYKSGLEFEEDKRMFVGVPATTPTGSVCGLIVAMNGSNGDGDGARDFIDAGIAATSGAYQGRWPLDLSAHSGVPFVAVDTPLFGAYEERYLPFPADACNPLTE